jgi:dipeptidyl-peptidase-3
MALDHTGELSFFISDPEETTRLEEFVDKAKVFISLLPWALAGDRNGKGPFEETIFEALDFTSLHGIEIGIF